MKNPLFIEASAGTGKTYTIETLVEGLLEETSLDRILVVTFTKAATRELKARIHQRIGNDIPIEEAKIYTIHSFCYQMLAEHPFEAAIELDGELSYEEQLDVARDFFRTRIDKYSPEEIKKALGKARGDPEALARLLLQSPNEPEELFLMAKDVQEMLQIAMEEKGSLTFDGILDAMRHALKNPAFLKAVRSRFDAAIVDEFQDTDLIQWEIFETLFLRPDFPFIVVGDPKQSIYAFRRADIYSYLKAREAIACRSTLSTNYRSRPKLVEALNTLFATPNLIDLPKLDKSLSIDPVTAGRTDDSDDNPITFIVGDEPAFFAFIVRTIVGQNLSLSSYAALVKDRYQSRRLQEVLESCNIPTKPARGKPMRESVHLLTLQRYVEAALDPSNRGKVAIALNTTDPTVDDFAKIHSLDLDNLINLYKQIEVDEPEMCQIACYIAERQRELPLDAIFEELATLEGDDAPTLEPPDDDAVTLLTTFASKGLEFDTVFALDLASSRREKDPERHAEKMRLLYVACTRPREQLYIFQPATGNGTSPIEELLSRIPPHNFPMQTVTDLNLLTRQTPLLPPKTPPTFPNLPSIPLQSFSSLSHTSAESSGAPTDFDNPEKTVATLPAGAKTGLLLHQALETGHLNTTGFEGWEHILQELVDCGNAFLSDKTVLMREMEFLYPTDAGMMTGIIDCVYEQDGKVYLLDWKSNWLEDYSEPNLQREMERHNYTLQAEIYKTAIEKYLRLYNKSFGGTAYVFLRGLPKGEGILWIP